MPAGTAVIAFFSLLAIQTSVALVFKFSQTNGKYEFFTSSAQTSAEVFKLALSVLLFARDRSRRNGDEKPGEAPAGFAEDLATQLNFRLVTQCGFLAALYCLNNQLAFVIFRWADAASITLIKSASSFVSALFLWLLLKRPVNHLQWISICIQVLGLVVVQYDDCKKSTLLPATTYAALLVSLCISSAAGVWNEHLLKTFSASLHAQNMCMYVYGVIFNVLIFLLWEKPAEEVLSSSLWFRGYSVGALGIIMCQAVLGLAVTAVLKFADTVVRSLASACSVSILYVANIVLFGWAVNLTYVTGCCIVFLSTYLYMAISKVNLQPPETKAAVQKTSETE